MLAVAAHLTKPWGEMQWEYLVSHFKPDLLISLGDYEPTGKIFKAAAREIPSGLPIVLMAPENGKYIQGETSLEYFTHPYDAAYVFGPDSLHIHDFNYDYSVYIPTDSDDEMFSWVAAGITLWDRKRWPIK